MLTHSALSKSHPAKELLPSALSGRPANTTGHQEREGSATGAAPCEGRGAVPPLLAAAGLFGTMAPHRRAGPAAFSTFPRAPGCPDTINNTVKPQGDQRAISKAISPCLEKCVFVPLPSWGDARSPRAAAPGAAGLRDGSEEPRLQHPRTGCATWQEKMVQAGWLQVFRVRKVIKVQSLPQSTAESTAATTKLAGIS